MPRPVLAVLRLPALLFAALVLCAPDLRAQLPQPMSEVELHALLLARGFTDVEAVAFEEGLWSATAQTPDGERASLHVHPGSGSIFLDDMQPELDAREVEERLEALGYEDVHRLVFEDGVWKADAEHPNGRELRVYVDPVEGAVLAERSD